MRCGGVGCVGCNTGRVGSIAASASLLPFFTVSVGRKNIEASALFDEDTLLFYLLQVAHCTLCLSAMHPPDVFFASC